MIFRSVRDRSGSLKKTHVSLTKENGDIGTSLRSHKSDDVDIKILQQKKHEAEVKR